MDAKMFPCGHPYGSGSVSAEAGSGQRSKVCQNRVLALQSWFRRNSRYAFWQMHQRIVMLLWFNNTSARRSQKVAAVEPSDNFTNAFGSVVPANIPESTAWWKNQARDLFAITDDAEAGPSSLILVSSAPPV